MLGLGGGGRDGRGNLAGFGAGERQSGCYFHPLPFRRFDRGAQQAAHGVDHDRTCIRIVVQVPTAERPPGIRVGFGPEIV